VRQAAPERKNNKNNDQSRNVYENKGNADNLPPKSSDILCKTTRIVGHFVIKRHEPSDIFAPNDMK